MSPSQARKALATALDGLTVTIGEDPIPVQVFPMPDETAEPPLAYVGLGDPAIERIDTAFGEHKVNLFITLVAPAGDNDVCADQLDEILTGALDRLDEVDDFIFDTVDQPGRIRIDGQPYLGAVVRCHLFTNLKEPS